MSWSTETHRSRTTVPSAKVTTRQPSSMRVSSTNPGAIREGPVLKSPITFHTASALDSTMIS
ncbi:hypothetical protein [Amycolatopsis sp. WAC 04169]|uniref:hypothetical protein n=1 Tax=Amycolatopsis sp. WAC 04169 TaxID=2203197 RepID=UPI001F362757|nr:hypothetical protein [Amycolatopsis sp. WAC 04169]